MERLIIRCSFCRIPMKFRCMITSTNAPQQYNRHNYFIYLDSTQCTRSCVFFWKVESRFFGLNEDQKETIKHKSRGPELVHVIVSYNIPSFKVVMKVRPFYTIRSCNILYENLVWSDSCSFSSSHFINEVAFVKLCFWRMIWCSFGINANNEFMIACECESSANIGQHFEPNLGW